MSIFPIWERYFLKELWKTVFLFLLVFFGLYVIIDYASHYGGAHYHHSRLKLLEIILHYSAEFSLQAEILLPFALLIATIHTLTSLNKHNELVALLASGYSLKRLLFPFILSGLVAVVFLYVNNEFFLPNAYRKLSRIDEKYSLKRAKERGLYRALHLTLDDGSILIYSRFDPELKRFLSLYLLDREGSVFRMNELDPFSVPPRGYFVDHYAKKEGILSYVSSSPSLSLDGLKINPNKLLDTLATPEEQPLSKLVQGAKSEEAAKVNEKAARELTWLYQKLATPWLALFAVLFPIPFCIRFSRNLAIFMIFAGGIFSLVSVYLLLDALVVLGERQVLSPSLAILSPLALILVFSIYRFIRIRT